MKTNWQTKKLGEIIIENKKSPLKSKGNEEGLYPFFVSGFKIKTADTYLIDGLNIFLPTGGNFFVHFFNGKAAYSTDTWAIKTSNNIDIKYLYYYLFLNQEFINKKLFKGATIKHLQKNDFKKFEIPFPCLLEQQRIVKILDEVFEKIEKVKKNTEKNLQNSKKIFESYLQNIFTNPSKKWKKVSLGEVSKIIMGQSPKGNTYNTKKDGLPLINGPVEFGSGQLGETHITKYTNKPTKICQKGTLILCVRGSTTGKTNIANYDSCLGRGVASITANNKIISQNLLNIYIASMRNIFFSLGTGSTFPNISSNIISKIEISIPPIGEQSDMVSKLEKLLSETKKLESIYKQKLVDLEELKKSILNKAFSGEL